MLTVTVHQTASSGRPRAGEEPLWEGQGAQQGEVQRPGNSMAVLQPEAQHRRACVSVRETECVSLRDRIPHATLQTLAEPPGPTGPY